MTITAKLRDIAFFNPKPALSTEDLGQVASFVPMAAISDIEACILTEENRSIGNWIKGFTYFQNDDILIAKITPCFENGKMALVKINNTHGFGSTEFHVIRADSTKVFPPYLFHYLRQERIRLLGEQTMTGSAGQKRVPKRFFENMDIPLPALEDQVRVAEILNAAYRAKQKRRYAFAKIQEVVETIFIDLFGSPQMNPRNWRVCSLGDILTSGPQNGLYRPASDYGDGYPILRIDSFYDGRVTDLASLKRVTLAPEEASRYELQELDVVINRVNSVEYLGKSCLIEGLTETTVFESNMMRMSLDQSVVNAYFLIQFLQSKHIKAQITSRAKRAVNQASINQQDVKSLQIYIPPLDAQTRFALIAKRLAKLRQAYLQSSVRLHELCGSIQCDLFSSKDVKKEEACLISIS